MKVYLSPSDQHGNRTASGHSEADHCLEIANAAYYRLKEYGIEASVGDNSRPGMYVHRVNEANKWPADLYVCIHTNAGGGEGTLMLAYDNASANNAYVRAIYDAVASLTPTTDKGIRIRNDLYEIRHTVMMCAYLEAEFHDNGKTEAWIDANTSNIGIAIADAIAKTAGYSKPIASNSAGDRLYRVQCGAFKNADNAGRLMESILNLGFDVFIKKDAGFHKVQCGAFRDMDNAITLQKSLNAKGIDSIIV